MTENGGNNSDVDWIYSGFSKEDNSDAASSKDSDVFVKPVSKPSESSHQESKDLEKLSADNFAPSSTAGGQNEDLLLEAEIAELKIMEERNNKLEDVRKRKQQAQEQFKRLSQNNQAAGASSVENIQYNAEQLRTNNREQSQSKVGKTGYQGPSIGEMRKNHYTSERVEPSQMRGICHTNTLSYTHTLSLASRIGTRLIMWKTGAEDLTTSHHLQHLKNLFIE